METMSGDFLSSCTGLLDILEIKSLELLTILEIRVTLESMKAKDTAVNGTPLFTSLGTYLAHAKTVRAGNEIFKISVRN